MKDLARKHDIVLVSPYQIDDAGEARFAKGLLDAADIALLMEAHDKDTQSISFETTKIRGGGDMHFTCPMDWDSLRISPQSIEKPAAKEKVKKAGKKQQNEHSTEPQEAATDLPWTT